jgi:hypothetical protein
MHVAQHGRRRDPGPRHARLGDQRLEIERLGRHRDVAVFPAPRIPWTIAIDFDAVSVGVGEIKGLADEVIRSPLQRRPRGDELPERRGQRLAGRHEHREVEEAGRPAHRTRTRPRGQLQEGRAGRAQDGGAAVPRVHVKPESLGVEIDRAAEIGDREGDRSPARVRRESSAR